MRSPNSWSTTILIRNGTSSGGIYVFMKLSGVVMRAIKQPWFWCVSVPILKGFGLCRTGIFVLRNVAYALHFCSPTNVWDAPESIQ